MKKTNSLVNYEKRITKVIEYIHDHLDEELDLNRLAEIAHMSPYHWHRIYFALQGETIVATVKRLRLHTAAGYLAHTPMPIDKIAKKTGYSNVQSFTRIFKSTYGLPPAQYRKNGSHKQFTLKKTIEENDMFEISIKTLPEMKVVSVPHTGSYMQISKSFEMLYGCLASRQLLKPTMRSIGIYYDDPASVPEDELRSRACLVTEGDIPLESPLELTQTSGGTYVVLHYKGPYADMKAAYQWLYGEWLINSGREAANTPVFEEYLNNPRDTAPNDLRTDICLPLV